MRTESKELTEALVVIGEKVLKGEQHKLSNIELNALQIAYAEVTKLPEGGGKARIIDLTCNNCNFTTPFKSIGNYMKFERAKFLQESSGSSKANVEVVKVPPSSELGHNLDMYSSMSNSDLWKLVKESHKKHGLPVTIDYKSSREEKIANVLPLPESDKNGNPI